MLVTTTAKGMKTRTLKCPYLFVLSSGRDTESMCVWTRRRINPKGCNDSLVRLFRISRGDTLGKKMLCRPIEY